MAVSARRPRSTNRAVFLDKDGTLIENVPYNVDPERVALLPGAAEALQTFHAAGYLLVVVSNQSGVARGRFDEQALRPVQRRLETLCADAAAPLSRFYYCPHHPDGRVPRYAIACDCRKPQPGLLLRAAEDHAIDLSHSWMIGDILDDIEAGRRAGCATILLNSGGETEWRDGPLRRPHCVARDLAEAAQVIMGREGTQ